MPSALKTIKGRAANCAALQSIFVVTIITLEIRFRDEAVGVVCAVGIGSGKPVFVVQAEGIARGS